MATPTTMDWMLNENAVYWAPPTTDTFNRKTWPTPIDIKCRWEDENEEILLAGGTKYVSGSQVYVDRKLKVGGALWYGTVAELTSATDPTKNDGWAMIQKMTRNPSFDADEVLRIAYL